MARVLITAQVSSPDGLAPALTAPTADGDKFDAGRVLLYVDNTAGDEEVDVTVTTPATFAGRAVADAGGTVAAGAFELFGPFPRALFARPDSGSDAGLVYVDYSAVTDVVRGLISV